VEDRGDKVSNISGSGRTRSVGPQTGVWLAELRIKPRKAHRELLNRRFKTERLKDDATKEFFKRQLDKSWKQTKEEEMETAEETRR